MVWSFVIFASCLGFSRCKQIDCYTRMIRRTGRDGAYWKLENCILFCVLNFSKRGIATDILVRGLFSFFVENGAVYGWCVPFTCLERVGKRRKGKEVLCLCGNCSGMLESSLNSCVFLRFNQLMFCSVVRCSGHVFGCKERSEYFARWTCLWSRYGGYHAEATRRLSEIDWSSVIFCKNCRRHV